MPEIAPDLKDESRCVSVHWTLPVQCVLPRGHRENWHEAWHPQTGNRLRYQRSMGGYCTEDLHHGEWHDLEIPPPGGLCNDQHGSYPNVRCTGQYGHGWNHRAIVDGCTYSWNTPIPKGLTVDQLTRDVKQLRGMLVAAHSHIADSETAAAVAAQGALPVPVGDQPQPLDDTRLAEIAARVEATSKGPWKVCEDYSDVLDGDGHQIISHFHDADGQFTAHARQDVPALLAEVERLKAELAKYVGQEPTVAEEMAYLRRSLDAVDALHLPEKLKVDSISRDYRNGYVRALADMREALELPAITAAEEAS
jgi:hypothetical protein